MAVILKEKGHRIPFGVILLLATLKPSPDIMKSLTN